MKNRDLLKKLTIVIASICLFLILTWVLFYLLTIGIIRRNMAQITEMVSDTMMEAAENELLSLENTADRISESPAALEAVSSEAVTDFFEKAASLDAVSDTDPTYSDPRKSIILFREDGTFYRIAGTISNTGLKRVYYQIHNKSLRSVTVRSHDSNYLGAVRPIRRGTETAGYVVTLMDQGAIERILSDYNELDYLGFVLFSGKEIYYSNRDLTADRLQEVKENAVFYREREIGLSGCSLLVYSERSMSLWLSRYFSVILPVIVLLLSFVAVMSIRYLKRYITNSRELERERSTLALLKKQISAHFTVNTLNVVRSLIHKGEGGRAEQICSELSVLLRYANAADEYISLLEEFWVLEQYVGIMQVRYPGMIDADIEADDSFEDILIPRMLLQPLVENAILHGLAGKAGSITVSAVPGNEDVTITVADDGSGMDDGALSALNEALSRGQDPAKEDLDHIALRNIQYRIRILCGEGYGLSVSSSKEERQGTVVTVRLPLLISRD